MHWRFIIPALVIAGLIGLLGYGLTRDPSVLPSTLIGKPAPSFELPRLKQPDRLVTAVDLAGEVSVVNFWASWCLGCREEHALLAELGERGAVPVYGMNYKDTRQQALRWLERYGDIYAAHAYDKRGRVGIDWGVSAVPETYVLDAEGVIRHKHVGAIGREDLEQTLLPLIQRLRAGRS